MVEGLERRQENGDLHFVTFSCFHQRGYLDSPPVRDLFEDALLKAQSRYRFEVAGYVVMPEHVHLLVSEPGRESLAVALQGLKLSVARRTRTRPFWLPRHYDFNVLTDAKRVEKLNYIHWNPMKRGLVERPEDWRWSSYRYYQTGEQGRVTIKGWVSRPLRGS
jgi:putative transposase